MASSVLITDDENALVERVFLRVGSADTDEQLEKVLAKFLTPLLRKLDSPCDNVRKKVFELLVHINKRLRSRCKILLPVNDLIEMFQDPAASSFIMNFTILYIKMGFPRIPTENQSNYIPFLMRCLEHKSSNHQAVILQLITSALQYLNIPEGLLQEAWLQQYQVNMKGSRTVLLDHLLDLILMTYSCRVEERSSESHSSSFPPPGMSVSSVRRVIGECDWSPDCIEKCKVAALNFLDSGLFVDTEVACHVVVASSDSRHGDIDWNNVDMINRLYAIFQGSVDVNMQSEVKAEEKRLPASTRIRLKIFQILLRSTVSVNLFPSSLQVVFDCLFGQVVHAKLRSFAVQFVHHMCLHCLDTKFATIDGILQCGMIKLLLVVMEDSKLRSLTYLAIGKIVHRSPHRVANDFTIVHQFFDAICQEEAETRLAVQEALSLMSGAFKQMTDSNMCLLEALLMENIEKVELQARVVATQYAASVFRSDHIPSRYILMLGAGDVCDNIRVDSVKTLRGISNGETTDGEGGQSLPDFASMVNYIHTKAVLREKSNNRYTVGNAVLPFNPLTYTEVVMYLRMCLAQQAGAKPTADLSDLPEQAPAVSAMIRHLLSHPQMAVSVHVYVDMIKQFLSTASSLESMYCLLETLAGAPQQLAVTFRDHLPWLKNLISSPKDEIRQHAGELVGIITVASGTHDDVCQAARDLLASINAKRCAESQQSSVISLGYLLEWWFAAASHSHADAGETNQDDVQMSVLISITQEQCCILESSVNCLYLMLGSDSTGMRCAVCSALARIAKVTALPLPSGADADRPDSVSKLSLVRKLVSMIKTSKEDSKTKEKAAISLGCLCVGDKEFPHRRMLMEDLFTAVQSKQVELQFWLAETLVNAALGCKAPIARNMWMQTEEAYVKSVSHLDDDIKWYLEQLLSTYVCHANPHLRQAACIWLYTLVKKCPQHEAVQTALSDIQQGFIHLLSDTDEVTQGIASNGLGLGYDICTGEQKDELVSKLVDTLLTGKSAKQTVTEETKLFGASSLGRSPDGGSLSTYKELCAIASDFNQPDLVYKFMHLANHNAAWNTRKGAAYGFSTIAAQASKQLTPYMDQIIPYLYRYQFDPNPRIQQAISSIWSALVKDNNKTVDLYLQEILTDLLKNLTSSQWRVRESSCMAVADVLAGRQTDCVVAMLPELWRQCLRVRDDIKESVRLSADTACRTLSKVSVKMCSPDQMHIGERATGAVLPCLLDVTLSSAVPEVRAIGMSTILQICRNAGCLLKPHIPLLVIALLEAVSSLEPQMINYLSFHVDNESTQDKLDKARIAASKSSPMMETVIRCVQYVDGSALAELVPRLVDLIKQSVGVSTKVGCSSFVVSLIHQCPMDLAPYASKLMAAFVHGLIDRSSSVLRSCASAVAHLVKIAKDSSTEKLICKLKSWYFDHEHDGTGKACSVTCFAISQAAPDQLCRHASLVAPLAFFAMHQETTDNTKTIPGNWAEVWSGITLGTEAGIRLYLPEITSTLVEQIDSSSWVLKAQAARSMATVAEKLGSGLGQPHLGHLLCASLGALSTRTWPGKEALLKCLSTICTSCKDKILQDDSLKLKVVEAVIGECKKSLITYKLASIACLGDILEAFQCDNFRDIYEIVTSALDKSPASDYDDTSVHAEELRRVAFTSLGQAWLGCSSSTQQIYREEFPERLLVSLPTSTFKVQVAILQTLRKFLERLAVFCDGSVPYCPLEIQNILIPILNTIIPCLENKKYSAVRLHGVSVIKITLCRLADIHLLHLVPGDLQRRLVDTLTLLVTGGSFEMSELSTQCLQALSSLSHL